MTTMKTSCQMEADDYGTTEDVSLSHRWYVSLSKLNHSLL